MCCFVLFAVLLNVLQGDVDNDSACCLHSRQELNVGQNGTHLPDTLMSIYTHLGRHARPLKYVASTLKESIIEERMTLMLSVILRTDVAGGRVLLLV